MRRGAHLVRRQIAEFLPWPAAAISHAFTLPSAAAQLGISEELLAEIAMDLEPEDGVLWVHDSTEDGCHGVTLLRLESVQEIMHDKPTLAFIRERMERNNSRQQEKQGST
jgi:hypothetical protein